MSSARTVNRRQLLLVLLILLQILFMLLFVPGGQLYYNYWLNTTITPMMTTPAIKIMTQILGSSIARITEEFIEALEKELPEVDYRFWYTKAVKRYYSYNRSCAIYPNPIDLDYFNLYWQTFINYNVTFRLYAAYLDTRDTDFVATVRILATANQLGRPFPPTYCQLWYSRHSVPLIVRVSSFLGAWKPEWVIPGKFNYPHIVSCPIVRGHLRFKEDIPRTVSLVSEECENASNSLRIHNNRNSTGTRNRVPSIGVCVKAIEFPFVDVSKRLIEWFELQRLLGASRIYSFLHAAHPNVQRVLDYYQRNGLLELRPLTQSNGLPPYQHYQHLLLKERLTIKRLNELIPYNDCFYRNIYRHDYMLNVDFDELVIPQGRLRTWQQVLNSQFINSRNSTFNCSGELVARCVVNAYFKISEPETENELFHLQYTLRRRQRTKPLKRVKCFHNSRYVLTAHNHLPLHWLGQCEIAVFRADLIQLQHYRNQLTINNGSKYVEDRSIWKYAERLRRAVKKAQKIIYATDDLTKKV